MKKPRYERRRELKIKFKLALQKFGESWRTIWKRHGAKRKLSLQKRVKLLQFVKGIVTRKEKS